MHKPKASTIAWLVAYLATMALLLWLLLASRKRVIQSLSNATARAEWQAWKEQVEKQQANPSTPVKRRAPKSNEPPGLVLMRDHFVPVASIALIGGSILFGFIAVVGRGMFSKTRSASAGPDKRIVGD